MQEMAGKENLPCDGHRGGRAQTSGASLIGSAGPGPGKDESPAWGKRGSLMGGEAWGLHRVRRLREKLVQRESGAGCGIFPTASGRPQNPLLAFWASMGSKPRHFMKVGMNQKRVARLDRVLSKACSRAQKEIQTWRR